MALPRKLAALPPLACIGVLPAQLLDPLQSWSFPRIQSNDHALDGYVIAPEVQSIERLRRFVGDILKRAAKTEMVQLQVHASEEAERRGILNGGNIKAWMAAQEQSALQHWQVALITRGRHTGTFRYRNGDRIVVEPLPGYAPERWQIYPATFEMLWLRMENTASPWIRNERPYALAHLKATGLFDEDTVRDLLAQLRSEYYSKLTHIVAASDVGCFAMDYAAFPLYYWFDTTPMPARAGCTKRVDCRIAIAGETRAACRSVTAPRHVQLPRDM